MVKLIVGNLPPSSTNQSLKDIFSQYEDLQDYKLISNYGFVYLESEQSAMHAVYNLNGIDYHGYHITVDYVGDNRNKRKLPNPYESNQFSKPVVLNQNRNVQPLIEQRNPNPYNLAFSNVNNGMSKSFSIPKEKRNFPQPLFEARNTNPYNLPTQNINMGLSSPDNAIFERRYGPPTFQDPRYGSMAYSNNANVQQDQYESYNDYNAQYIPEEEYFSNPVPLKRSRTDPFMDNNTYDYCPYKPTDFTEDEFRQYRVSQPSWFDNSEIKVRSSYLHPRDEPFYRPRGRRTYQSNKSYIDEYEDDRDYGDIDPYPAYLKQYQK